MNIRKHLKFLLYGRCPGLAGAFPYFGIKVYFPPGSQTFRRVCESGIFEPQNLALLRSFAKPDTYYLDVGSHLGLMSIPLLKKVPGLRVVSFEPSPNSAPFLRRTVAQSGHADRWSLVEKALSNECGSSSFSRSREDEALYDGLLPTGRAATAESVAVPVSTLDAEWLALGKPPVSLIKIDVEGAELGVLNGGVGCLRACRPHLLIEWQRLNYQAYGSSGANLIEFADREGYQLYAAPELIPIDGVDQLETLSVLTESFLLAPRSSAQPS